MQLGRKALYSALRMSKAKEKVPYWQIEDFRKRDLDALFEELQELHISLNEKQFLKYAENYDSPEEMADVLAAECPEPDHAFLILFELWRRLLPSRPSLSIFLDELDEQIHLFDEGALRTEEMLHEALSNLQSILEEHLDMGEKAEQIFEFILPYVVNDLESFLYDYMMYKMDEGDFLYASELLAGFYPFVKEKAWFDFLKARLLLETDPEKALSLFTSFVEQENGDVELYLEILSFLASSSERELFLQLAKKTLPLLQTEDAFQDFLFTAADFFHFHGSDEQDKHIQEILQKRHDHDHANKIDASDPDFLEIQAQF